MGRFSTFCLVMFLVLAAFSQEPGTTPTVEQLFKQAEETAVGLNDYSGKFIKHELFGKEVRKAIISFKFAKPFKVYLRFHEPHEGREGIYIRGWNDDELKAHKGSFPDITMNLDPQGGLAMEDNHHPVTQFGFESMIRMSKLNMGQAVKRKEGDFKVADGGTLHGKPVWKVEARYPKEGYFTTAREDETLWDISRRTGMDMYMILHSNKDYDDPDDPDEGDKVFIPRYYGSKIEYLMDKQTGLPIKTTTWDHAGRLYECYDFVELELNVGLTAKDFDPDNPKYNF